MKDDYTTNSHQLSYTFLFKWLGESAFRNYCRSERVKRLRWTTSAYTLHSAEKSGSKGVHKAWFLWSVVCCSQRLCCGVSDHVLLTKWQSLVTVSLVSIFSQSLPRYSIVSQHPTSMFVIIISWGWKYCIQDKNTDSHNLGREIYITITSEDSWLLYINYHPKNAPAETTRRNNLLSYQQWSGCLECHFSLHLLLVSLLKTSMHSTLLCFLIIFLFFISIRKNRWPRNPGHKSRKQLERYHYLYLACNSHAITCRRFQTSTRVSSSTTIIYNLHCIHCFSPEKFW